MADCLKTKSMKACALKYDRLYGIEPGKKRLPSGSFRVSDYDHSTIATHYGRTKEGRVA